MSYLSVEDARKQMLLMVSKSPRFVKFIEGADKQLLREIAEIIAAEFALGNEFVIIKPMTPADAEKYESNKVFSVSVLRGYVLPSDHTPLRV